MRLRGTGVSTPPTTPPEGAVGGLRSTLCSRGKKVAEKMVVINCYFLLKYKNLDKKIFFRMLPNISVTTVIIFLFLKSYKRVNLFHHFQKCNFKKVATDFKNANQHYFSEKVNK